MSKELCRVTIDTNNYYAELDKSQWADYYDEDIEMNEYYDSMHPEEEVPKKD